MRIEDVALVAFFLGLLAGVVYLAVLAVREMVGFYRAGKARWRRYFPSLSPIFGDSDGREGAMFTVPAPDLSSRVRLGPPRPLLMVALATQESNVRVSVAAQPAAEARETATPSLLASTVRLGPARPIAIDPGEVPDGLWLRRGAPLTIPARHDPLWKEKGWRREGDSYHGSYRVGDRSWLGRIDIPYPGGFTAYIWDPPLGALANHPKRLCFMNGTANGRFLVHFHEMPANLDHAINNIETILAEALGVRR
jgi:hypothetical protein